MNAPKLSAVEAMGELAAHFNEYLPFTGTSLDAWEEARAKETLRVVIDLLDRYDRALDSAERVPVGDTAAEAVDMAKVYELVSVIRHGTFADADKAKTELYALVRAAGSAPERDAEPVAWRIERPGQPTFFTDSATEFDIAEDRKRGYTVTELFAAPVQRNAVEAGLSEEAIRQLASEAAGKVMEGSNTDFNDGAYAGALAALRGFAVQRSARDAVQVTPAMIAAAQREFAMYAFKVHDEAVTAALSAALANPAEEQDGEATPCRYYGKDGFIGDRCTVCDDYPGMGRHRLTADAPPAVNQERDS